MSGFEYHTVWLLQASLNSDDPTPNSPLESLSEAPGMARCQCLHHRRGLAGEDSLSYNYGSDSCDKTRA